jgi:hypothetical protein
MCLDIIGWLVARNRPPVPPISRRFDSAGFEPQLERFSNDHGTGPMGGGCHIYDRHQLSRKRHVDLSKIRFCHVLTVSDRNARYKTPVRSVWVW